jgi:hypothetical protein
MHAYRYSKGNTLVGTKTAANMASTSTYERRVTSRLYAVESTSRRTVAADDAKTELDKRYAGGGLLLSIYLHFTGTPLRVRSERRIT